MTTNIWTALSRSLLKGRPQLKQRAKELPRKSLRAALHRPSPFCSDATLAALSSIKSFAANLAAATEKTALRPEGGRGAAGRGDQGEG